MSALDAVVQCWNDLAHRHGCAGPASQAVLDELVAAYGEPHRVYHTLDHIAALLHLLAAHGQDARDRGALQLAILFHDVVYDPSRGDNEAASADVARQRLTELGISDETTSKVVRLVLATQHGSYDAAAADPDFHLLLDLDLSVLAADEGDYRAYAEAIRREYALYPDEVYLPGRRRVLQAFLARQRIYQTVRLRAQWEARARANIADEISRLG